MKKIIVKSILLIPLLNINSQRIGELAPPKKPIEVCRKKLIVLVEALEGDFYIGRSYRDAQKVDGEVLIDRKHWKGLYQPVGHYVIKNKI